MEDKEKQMLDTYFHKDEFGNYVISEFEDLGFDLDFEELNLLTKSLNIIGNHIEYLQKELSKSNEKLKKIEEYVKGGESNPYDIEMMLKGEKE